MSDRSMYQLRVTLGYGSFDLFFPTKGHASEYIRQMGLAKVKDFKVLSGFTVKAADPAWYQSTGSF